MSLVHMGCRSPHPGSQWTLAARNNYWAQPGTWGWASQADQSQRKKTRFSRTYWENGRRHWLSGQLANSWCPFIFTNCLWNSSSVAGGLFRETWVGSQSGVEEVWRQCSVCLQVWVSVSAQDRTCLLDSSLVRGSRQAALIIPTSFPLLLWIPSLIPQPASWRMCTGLIHTKCE